MIKACLCVTVLVLVAASPRMAYAQDKILNLYAWADYFDPAVLDDFTKETGIQLTYDSFVSNEAGDARLAAGHSGYDVVMLSGPLLQKEIAGGLLQKLDKAKLPKAQGFWPEISANLAAYDPGLAYGVNYMWFTMGVSFNAQAIEARHGEAALTSWDVMFRPDVLKKFSDCGVEVQDSPYDLFALALRYLRLDPRSRSLGDLNRAAELLYGLRRNVKSFRPANDVSGLASGDICLALSWSSDASQARRQAYESDSSETIDYAAPKGGMLLLLDNLAIPKDAPHPEAAYAFINFLMRPEIAARNTIATHFANSIAASKAFLPQEILGDRSIYPDDATMKALFVKSLYGPAEQAFITREWIHIKTGK